MPDAWPATIPVPEPTVAIPAITVLQVPPAVESLKNVRLTEQTVFVPDIDAGSGSTVI